MKKTKGNVTMAFVTSNRGPNYCEIRVQDDVSLANLTTIQLTKDQFYDMMSGLGRCDCEVEVYDTYDKVGLKREHKQVTITDKRLNTSKWMEPLLEVLEEVRSEYEVDGWKFNPPCSGSSLSQGQHNGERFNVQMLRYVEPTTEESTDAGLDW